MTRFRWLLALMQVGLIGAMACGGGGPTAPEVLNAEPGATPTPLPRTTPHPGPTPGPCESHQAKNHPCID